MGKWINQYRQRIHQWYLVFFFGMKMCLSKVPNIIGESVVRAGLSTYPLIFIILSDLRKSTISLSTHKHTHTTHTHTHTHTYIYIYIYTHISNVFPTTFRMISQQILPNYKICYRKWRRKQTKTKTKQNKTKQKQTSDDFSISVMPYVQLDIGIRLMDFELKSSWDFRFNPDNR